MKYIKRFNEKYDEIGDIKKSEIEYNYWKESYELNDGSAKEIFDECWDKYIEPDCSIYIKEISGSKPLVRGTYLDSNTLVGDDLMWRKPRKNRIPRDVDIMVHEKLDDLFQEKFGVSVRSEGIFSTKRISNCTEYGSPFLIFPIGPFRYFWNPNVDDLYTPMEFSDLYNFYVSDDESYLPKIYGQGVNFDKMSDEEDNNWINKHRDIAHEAFTSELEDMVNAYKDDDIKLAKSQEIVIVCEEYYLLDVTFLKFVYDKLGIDFT